MLNQFIENLPDMLYLKVVANPAVKAVATVLCRLLDENGMRLKELQGRMKISRATVSRHVNGKSMPSVDDRAEYATAFGIAFHTFEEMWKEERSRISGGYRNTGPVEEKLFEVPTYDLPAHAGPWSELVGAEEVSHERDPRVIDQGLFRVRIHGDCMTPRWVDGELIEFEIWRQGESAMPIGEDVALTDSDGQTTFKKLERFDPATEELVLRARNPDYPEEIRVSFQMLARIAVAKHAIVKKPK